MAALRGELATESDGMERCTLNTDISRDPRYGTGMNLVLIRQKRVRILTAIPGGRRSRTGVGKEVSFGVVDEAGLTPVFPRSFSSSVVLNNQSLVVNGQKLARLLPPFANCGFRLRIIPLSRGSSGQTDIGESARHILEFAHHTYFILPISKDASLFPSLTRVAWTSEPIRFVILALRSLWRR